jgi:hypothetical protein
MKATKPDCPSGFGQKVDAESEGRPKADLMSSSTWANKSASTSPSFLISRSRSTARIWVTNQWHDRRAAARGEGTEVILPLR